MDLPISVILRGVCQNNVTGFYIAIVFDFELLGGVVQIWDGFFAQIKMTSELSVNVAMVNVEYFTRFIVEFVPRERVCSDVSVTSPNFFSSQSGKSLPSSSLNRMAEELLHHPSCSLSRAFFWVS